jgi:hypothetical protein
MMMTEALQFDQSILKYRENVTQALSVFCTSQDILIVSFNEGETLVGRKDSSSGQFNGFKVKVHEDLGFNQSNCK